MAVRAAKGVGRSVMRKDQAAADAYKRRRQPAPREKKRREVTYDNKISCNEPPTPLSSYEENPSPATEMVYILELDPLSELSSRNKALLHHFVTNTSMIASHPHIREQACSHILPMVFQIPSLMYATIALSALHHSTLLNDVPDKFIPEEDVRDLLSMSLRHLRQELQNNDPQKREALLNTVRTLCVCEIYSGKADCSWRIHVDGARAILESTQTLDKHFTEKPRNWLTARWYESMEALSSLTNRHSFRACTEGEQVSRTVTFGITKEECLLDIYAGYSSDLNTIFREIGALECKFRCSAKGKSDDTSSTQKELDSEMYRLESIVEQMIRRDRENGLKPAADVILNNDEIRQFSACNAAYQYSALIHIYRRLGMMSSNSTKVQACVKEILDTICGVLPILPLSPWALLTTPIFTAGCEAIGQDQELGDNDPRKSMENINIRPERRLDYTPAHYILPVRVQFLGSFQLSSDFVGIFSHGMRVKFTHLIDSHDIDGSGECGDDVGEFTKLPNGDDLEIGEMPAPHLGEQVRPYKEVWRELMTDRKVQGEYWIIESIDGSDTQIEDKTTTLRRTFYARAGGFFLALRQTKERVSKEGSDNFFYNVGFSAIRQDLDVETNCWSSKYSIGKVDGMWDMLSGQEIMIQDVETMSSWEVGDKIVIINNITGKEDDFIVRAVGQ
ncbi:hypothetical protein B7463_g11285, partial [Scytalidium lignicola]